MITTGAPLGGGGGGRSLGNQTLGKSEKRKEGLGNRLGQKCTLRNVISVNYLPANAGLEDFYIPHSGCATSNQTRFKTEDFSN